MRRLARAAFVLVALIGFAVPATAAQIAFPSLTGRVVDQANILNGATEQSITNSSASLETSTGNQLVVVTLSSLQGQTIEEYGYQLGRQWGIGRQGKNNGVLLVVAPNERNVRIEVGYGLEGTITDALARGIIEQEILPRFRSNDYNAGTRAGAAAIVAVLMGDASTASRLTEAGSRKVAPAQGNWTWPIIVFIVIFFLIPRFFGGGGFRRRGPGGIWIGGSSGRGGGGFGGGFSVGGGSFGGGGASGRW